jgi:transcriptional pleiotropic repressor
MRTLLERTRRINKLLLKTASNTVDFGVMSTVLCELIGTNIYIVNNEGAILGYALVDSFECEIMKEEVLRKSKFPPEYNKWILEFEETASNIPQKKQICVFKDQTECIFNGKLMTIVPMKGGGERLGTLILAKFQQEFTDEDLILAEYGATVVGMEILRVKSEKIEEEARKKAAVQIALGTLSYSELEAVIHIFDELEGSEGLLVASKIADRVGITRSVIVNALRKFESAGVIESQSLGMKGTYIKVLNERLLEELKKINKVKV